MKKHSCVTYSKRTLAALLAALTLFSCFPCMGASAAATDSSAGYTLVDAGHVIVSMGDSYSSGEGNEEFYGQELGIDKVHDQDWLAHRSKESWPGRLYLPAVGTMKAHRGKNWFFVATSGATTEHINGTFKKKYNQDLLHIGSHELDPQIAVFGSGYADRDKKLSANDCLNGKKADYVTITIGGNDLGFKDILTTAVLNSTYAGFEFVWLNLEKAKHEFNKKGGYRDDIKQAYYDIYEAAGEDCSIIVAGYPKLIDPAARSIPISREEARQIDDACSWFNTQIEALVEECYNEGMPIYFADVESSFENHGAYADDPWLHSIMAFNEPEDLDILAVTSAYSMHPYGRGLDAYALAVQSVLDRLEGRVSGYVKDKDKKPVADAVVTLYKGDELVDTEYTDAHGYYAFVDTYYEMTADSDYHIKVEAEDFDPSETEPFIIVGDTRRTVVDDILVGYTLLSGFVKDRESKEPIEGAAVRLSSGGRTETVMTDEKGFYSFSTVLGLPAGEYSLSAVAEGYNESRGVKVGIGTNSKYLEADDIYLGDYVMLYGFVKDALTNEPVEGATVQLRSEAATFSETTDKDGYYDFGNERDIPEGKYGLSARAEGYGESKTQSIRIREDTEEEKADDILLGESNAVSGYVRDEESGEPIEGARVTLSSGKKEVTTTANEKGYFRFGTDSELTAGVYSIHAKAPGYEEGKKTVIYIPKIREDVDTGDILLKPGDIRDDLIGTWVSDSLYWSSASYMTLNEDGSCILDVNPIYVWYVEDDTIVFEDSVGAGYRSVYTFSFDEDGNLLMNGNGDECVYRRGNEIEKGISSLFGRLAKYIRELFKTLFELLE